MRKFINLIESIDREPEEKKKSSGWWWKDGGDRPQIPEPLDTVDDTSELAELLQRTLTMHDQSDPEADAEAHQEVAILKKALLDLKPIYERILRMRYGVGFDQEMDVRDIGKALRMTPTAVSQLERTALRILRKKLSGTFPERKDNSMWGWR